MKGYKIVLSWLCTVVFGSLLLPVAAYFYISIIEGSRGMSPDFEGYFLFAFISILASAVLSSPTLVTLVIANVIIKRKKRPFRKNFRKINTIHILMAFLTVVIAGGIYALNIYTTFQNFGGLNGEGFDMTSIILPIILNFCLVVLWYLFCTIPIWFLFFRKDIKNATAQDFLEHQNVIDDLN